MNRGRAGRRLLLVRGGAMGDFIVTLPIMQALQDSGAEVHLLTRSAYATLALNEGLATSYRSLDSALASPLFDASATLHDDWHDWLSGFGEVISWVPDRDGIFQSRVRQCGVPLFRQQPWCCDSVGKASSQLARGLGLTLPSEFKLRKIVDGISNTQRDAFHPGSGSISKNRPLDQWLTLFRTRKVEHVLLILGEAEEALADGTAEALRETGFRCDLARNLTLSELAQALAACSRFFGHDSGPAHLAAACGLPGYLYFGPTDPSIWAPTGAHILTNIDFAV